MTIASFLDRRNNNLDLMRIILAVLVIVGHSPILNGPGNVWIDPINYFFKFTYVHSLAVKIFFFISGLVVTNSLIQKKSVTYFIISRVFRLLPALIFVLVLTVFIIGPLLTTLNINSYFSGLDWLRYLLNNIRLRTVYFLPGMFAANPDPGAVNGSLWSLAYEAGCYIVLLGLFLITQERARSFFKYFFLVILADALLPNQPIFTWLGKNPDIALLPLSFGFGSLLAVHADKITINLKMVLGFALLYIVCTNTQYAPIVFLFTCFTAVVYISSSRCFLKFKPRFDISYGVYLWGFLVQQTLFQLWGHLPVGMHCLLAILLSMALALITHILIEKPFMAMGKSVYRFLRQKSS